MAELVFEDVSISYRSGGDRGTVDAVKGVSLTVPAGGSLGIAGESGSGKSTLAMAVLRLLPRTAKVTGRVLVDGRDVLDLSFGQLRALRWSEAAIVFQGAMHSLNPVHRVGAQVVEALELHVKDGYANDEARQARMLDLLAQVDLEPAKAAAYPHELSGGQRQRVMIAMALACDPDLVIADEPTTALDVVVQHQVLSVLREQVAGRGIALVFISHDLSVLASTCERIAVMRDGVVVEEGPSHQVVTAPAHPYTATLAKAFPTIGDPASRLRPATRVVEEPLPAIPASGSEQANSGHPDRSATATPATEAVGAVGAVDRAEPPVLGAEHLTVRFRTREGSLTAVDDVSLTCHRGEVVALVGQSGSGKTTLARTLLGLHRADAGRVLFRGEPLAASPKELRTFRRSVQLVLQDPTSALNPRHSVYESVAEGLRIHRLPGDERAQVEAALERAELRPAASFTSSLPQELSGGQRQRVVIAGALALEPQFLVADEPVASLDASVRGEILALLLRLKRQLGLGALVITHDLGLAWNIADRVLVMYRGSIVESGTVEQVLLDPQDAYTKTLLAAVPQLR
jgi:ABC-type glutathione transport system ATPase component